MRMSSPLVYMFLHVVLCLTWDCLGVVFLARLRSSLVALDFASLPSFGLRCCYTSCFLL